MGINRNYDILFTNQSTEIATLDSLVAGTGYTEGDYTDVPLTGGSGSGATANISVNGSGEVSSVIIVEPGSGYDVVDTLSADAANIGGTGSGFTIDVATITTDFVSEPFRLDEVKAEFRKPFLRFSGSLDGGSISLETLIPSKNKNESDNSYSSADWKSTGDEFDTDSIDPLYFFRGETRLKLSNLGANADFSAQIIYNAE